MKKLTSALLTISASLFVAGSALAFDQIKMMIPANPGGGWDQTGRSLGAAIVSAGQAKGITYDNKGGAGGTIGLSQFVNTEKANPNALMVMGAVMVGGIEMSKPPVTLKNVTPIARLTADTMIVVVPTNSPIQSMKDLTEKLKANPGSVSWGGGSKGSVDHILAGLIAKEVGVDPAKVNYIPFAGGGEAKAAVLGGQVTVGLAGVSEFSADVEAGKMRALAISSSFKLRNFVTLKEQGINVEIYNWRGVYAAPGITADQRKALIDAVVKTTDSASWKETLKKNDWGSFVLTGDDFGKFSDAESTRIGAILRDLGVAK
jgi:putative tricarboxylic transport membrane protein